MYTSDVTLINNHFIYYTKRSIYNIYYDVLFILYTLDTMYNLQKSCLKIKRNS